MSNHVDPKTLKKAKNLVQDFYELCHMFEIDGQQHIEASASVRSTTLEAIDLYDSISPDDVNLPPDAYRKLDNVLFDKMSSYRLKGLNFSADIVQQLKTTLASGQYDTNLVQGFDTPETTLPKLLHALEDFLARGRWAFDFLEMLNDFRDDALKTKETDLDELSETQIFNLSLDTVDQYKAIIKAFGIKPEETYTVDNDKRRTVSQKMSPQSFRQHDPELNETVPNPDQVALNPLQVEGLHDLVSQARTAAFQIGPDIMQLEGAHLDIPTRTGILKEIKPKMDVLAMAAKLLRGIHQKQYNALTNAHKKLMHEICDPLTEAESNNLRTVVGSIKRQLRANRGPS